MERNGIRKEQKNDEKKKKILRLKDSFRGDGRGERTTRAQKETRFFFPDYFLAYRPLSWHEENQRILANNLFCPFQFHFSNEDGRQAKNNGDRGEKMFRRKPSRCRGKQGVQIQEIERRTKGERSIVSLVTRKTKEEWSFRRYSGIDPGSRRGNDLSRELNETSCK